MIDLSTIPQSPGCYIYRNKDQEIIYIGKAKNLKKRVSSYFQKRDHDPKTRVLVRNIESVDFILTENEVEALILENTLIKKHKPKYNIDLKDAKNYAFIHLTGDDFPRIGILRKATTQGKLYGPFVSAADRDVVLDVVKKTFKLRSCRNMPKRACLRYHIGHCSAPCIGNISKADYQKNIDKADYVLRGNTDELIQTLHEEMGKYSKSQEFELAMELRDQISSLEYLKTRQNMERRINHDEDVINYIVRKNKIYIIVFNVIKGTLVGREEFAFDYSRNFLEEFLVQYYSGHETPAEIILPEESEILEEEAYTGESGYWDTDTETGTDSVDEQNAVKTTPSNSEPVLENAAVTVATVTDSSADTSSKPNAKSKSKNKGDDIADAADENESVADEKTGRVSQSLIDFLSQRHGKTVKITVPKRGDKKVLLDLAEKNIELAFFGSISKAEELGRRLMLPKTPSVIECFDISHLSGTNTVASMVQFRDGRPDKSNYRRFKIRTVEGINDFASIAEVVNRRYSRLLDENKDLPDLILIDGGKGQLSYAVDELKKLGVKTPVISLAEREEEVFVPGMSEPLPIKKDEKASLYLQEIRDEAHRFAITYNRLLREKTMRD
ncbi:UvrABC system protein C [Methanosarcinaceae archaeon Ag5]|uniref:UvrABC system protein C n=1 Tax=Methanolapillus africanus TaxID=3028297 RepID=A0AAE4MJZ6_9EURY|nr:UvrABC system protein C [Methanosarcinaceae archaeon Ag5]